MNEKITLPSLVAILSQKTGDTKKQSEDFIKEFFALVSDHLQNGEQIKIKDIGVFKTIEVEARKSVNVSTGEEFTIPGHRKVVFIPSKEIAAEVNSPFEMFETVELSDDITEEELATEVEVAEVTEATETSPEEATEPLYKVPEEVKTAEEVAEEATEEVAEEDIPEVPTDEPVEATVVAPIVAATEEPVQEEAAEDKTPEEEPAEIIYPARKRQSRHRFLWGMVCGMLLAILLLVVYALVAVDDWRVFCPKALVAQEAVAEPVDSNEVAEEIVAEDTEAVEEEQIAEETPAKEESKEELVPTQPSDSPVYDTITKTRYLTTMAKDHYGNYHLWPYIYIENSAMLGHPDRIKPGTKVVIPNLSKYGVNPNDPKDIEKAKQKGVEIYNKYK